MSTVMKALLIVLIVLGLFLAGWGGYYVGHKSCAGREKTQLQQPTGGMQQPGGQQQGGFQQTQPQQLK